MVARHNPPLIAARSFEAAARHKSFQKAATELNVTPTAISHQVKRLEDYLGQALFVRLNRAVELTADGVALAHTLQDIFVRLEQALDPDSRRTRSTINISAMPSLAAKWLAPRLPGFEARHPQWQIRLDAQDELVDFSSGKVDVALRYGAGKYPGLHAQYWMDASVFPVCSPALLETIALSEPADLRHHTLIHAESTTGCDRPPDWADWLAAAQAGKIDARRGPRFNSIYMALEAAQAGHGVALAPASLVERDLASGRLLKPLALELANPFAFWIVCPPRSLQDQKIIALFAWLQEQAAQLSAADAAPLSRTAPAYS